MTVVIAYTRDEMGTAAIHAATTELALAAGEEVILVSTDRGAVDPEVAQIEAEWPELAGRLSVQRGDLHDPSDSVVQVAQRTDARVIVLGLQHRSPVGKMIFGSTAQRILLDATCSVLAVKASQ